MITEILKSLYVRDLNKLKQEIMLYTNEQNIWRSDKNILNPAGNLCLHLVGNLNAYIGAELGHSGYVRNRPGEFSLKDVPRQQLVEMIDNTINAVEKALDNLTAEQLEADYPQVVLDSTVSTAYFLLHLATHLGYHLGQVNYHRRLLDY